MQAPTDLIAQHQRQMAEQAAAGERARVQNVAVFQRMWLSLGRDVTLLGGTRHDAELAEAKGLAAARWERLIDIEQQVQREEQALAVRPKKRPGQPTDDTLPDRTIEKQAREWEDDTKHRRASLAELKELAKKERRELEGYVERRNVKGRRG